MNNYKSNSKSSYDLTTGSMARGTFDAALEKASDKQNNYTYTTNGALVYDHTKSKLLDFNYNVSAYRNAFDYEILNAWSAAFNESPELAMRLIFWIRDCREGAGERKVFRTVLKDMAQNGMANIVNAVIPYIAEYGRWDDIVELIVPETKTNIINIIRNQLTADMKNMQENKPISLIFKWLPSINTSSKETVKKAELIRAALGITARQYRKMLAAGRNYSNVVEVKMSSNNWEDINYEQVPSKANLIYKNAFMKHDPDRREAYIDALSSGEAKINAATLMPHEIIHKLTEKIYGWNASTESDTVLEALWNNLPDMTDGSSENTLVIADGSGSMQSSIGGNSHATCLDVSNAMAIYFAERAKGQFKNKYISFSSKPVYVDLGTGSLESKLRIAQRHNECENTNIERVFQLLLDTAIENHLAQEDMPTRLLIVSDMQFDSMVCIGEDNYWYDYIPPTKTFFEEVSEKWAAAGYKLPHLVFWNVRAFMHGGVPVTENEMGVTLVSGFSQNILKMAMSDQLDAYNAMLDTIMAPRYDIIQTAVHKAIEAMRNPEPRAFTNKNKYNKNSGNNSKANKYVKYHKVNNNHVTKNPEQSGSEKRSYNSTSNFKANKHSGVTQANPKNHRTNSERVFSKSVKKLTKNPNKQ